MLKFHFRNAKTYEWFYDRPSLFRFAGFELKYLSGVSDESTFAKIIRRIRLANGSYKTTQVGRFGEVDDYLTQLLQKGKKYRIHDVAASDGITSTELIRKLQAIPIGFDFLISDKYSRIFYRERYGCIEYLDSDGITLRSSVWGIMADKGQAWKFALTKLLGILLAQVKLFEGAPKKEILLLNPVTLQFMEKESVTFIDYDIFDQSPPKEEGFDIIRAMNILNLTYFSEVALVTALRNILSSLKENGLFIVGRTNTRTNQNHATIYRKENNRMLPLRSFHTGSEIDHLVQDALVTKEQR